MEYRIVDNTGKIIAWIDTNNKKQLIHKDYILEVGGHLNAVEVDGNIVPSINCSQMID